MNRTTLIGPILILFVIALVAVGFYWLQQRSPSTGGPSPTLIASGSPTSSPVSHPLIQVRLPQPNERVYSPLVVSGQAQGQWFFEGSFPVVLKNADGVTLAEGVAQAQGEWMTEEFVPFSALLEFDEPPSGERGFLILKKDNPSGLPENDDQVEIPIYFQ